MILVLFLGPYSHGVRGLLTLWTAPYGGLPWYFLYAFALCMGLRRYYLPTYDGV